MLVVETPLVNHRLSTETGVASAATPSAGESIAFWSTGLATLMLPSEGLAVFHERTALELLGGRGATALAQAMDATRAPDGEGRTSAGEMGTAGPVLVSSGLSVGYVLWLARGGVLAASLMSSVPAWASVDPLPVLAKMRKGGAQGDTDGEDPEAEDFDPIERLFSRANQRLKRLLPGAHAGAHPGAQAGAQPGPRPGPQAVSPQGAQPVSTPGSPAGYPPAVAAAAAIAAASAATPAASSAAPTLQGEASVWAS